MITASEVERRLREHADKVEVPRPSAHQLQRILARRARGDRVDLPIRTSDQPRPIVRWVVPLAALAAGILLVAYFSHWHESSWPRPARTGLLMAQASSTPTYPIFRPSTGLGLRVGRWTYTTKPPSELAQWDTLLVYSVMQSEHAGKAAWLLLAGKQFEDGRTVFTDSTWVAREGIEILAHRADTLDTWQPVPANFLAVLQGADLALNWKASVPLLEPSQQHVTIGRWFNLRVYGEEEIEVPAGRFTCWKVGFSPDIRFYFWISKDGWPIRQGMSRVDDLSYGKMNLFLVREEEM